MWHSISYYAVLVFEALVGIFGLRLYEEPHYQVIERIGDRVEIRRYAPRLAAQAELPRAGESGRGDAFRLLFAYIAGANLSSAQTSRIAMTVPVQVTEKNRIAMTAPVQTAETSGGTVMRFFLPAQYALDNAPKPLDARVALVQVPAETVAALRFSGSGRDVSERQAELIAKLEGTRWRPASAPYALFYDAPFTLPFLRRNEAAVAVTEKR
jgi:SOUL heme-binding protein